MKTSLLLRLALLSASSVLINFSNAAEPDGATVYSMTEVEQAPVAISQQPPRYPEKLKAAHVTGEAVVSFVVDKNGQTKEVCSIRDTDTLFGEAAVAAVRQWRFNPGIKDGHPVACRVDVPIVFSL